MTNDESAIEVAGLKYRYGNRVALAGLDLRVEKGEIFALLGPNGGGKTTLFRLLSTLIPVQQGSAKVLGYDVTDERA
ncbi:MAG TPA: ATP-binding cassette domain-containing protein, partial [Pirellulales bacterium]|nr:ATP-binding cassette domain-containing protein [Pirellulales bacterium]